MGTAHGVLHVDVLRSHFTNSLSSDPQHTGTGTYHATTCPGGICCYWCTLVMGMGCPLLPQEPRERREL